uniref:DCC1-like thiol-disulfide oxidoreductase family protein n=1 Tax=Pseudomonas aeruginosa TaxID=287 RepID=UPI001A9EEF6E|nr:DCC1-like thiol-disulfide oxidoreductase family protein [Pseudomonas aeruginosa]
MGAGGRTSASGCAVAPRGTRRAARLAPDHFDTWLFVDGAYACDDNDALLEVLRLLPGPWRHLHWLRLLPAWLRDECHEALRRNRWRWFGRQRPPLRRRSWRPRRA